MLHRDPKKRPTLVEMKRDPFFAEIEWDKLERKEIEPPSILCKDNYKNEEEDQEEGKQSSPSKSDKRKKDDLVR